MNKWDDRRDQERKNLRAKIAYDTYQVDGAYYWKLNGAAVPLDTFMDAGFPIPSAQSAAVRAHTDKVLAEWNLKV